MELSDLGQGHVVEAVKVSEVDQTTGVEGGQLTKPDRLMGKFTNITSGACGGPRLREVLDQLLQFDILAVVMMNAS